MVDIVDILDVVDVLTVLDVEVVSASIERRTISFQRATNVETLIAAVPGPCISRISGTSNTSSISGIC